MLRSTEKRIASYMGKCIIFVLSLVANRNSVPLSGKPKGMSFSWGCMNENFSATRTLKVRLTSRF